MTPVEFVLHNWKPMFCGLTPEEVHDHPEWQRTLALFGAEMVAAAYHDRKLNRRSWDVVREIVEAAEVEAAKQIRSALVPSEASNEKRASDAEVCQVKVP